MLKRIIVIVATVVAVLVLGFVAVVVMQPNEFSVSRSASMSAPADVVFEQVNDFHKWEAWSPWAKLDPNAKNSFDGPELGKGAKFSWAGNDQVGEGGMTIIESEPGKRVRIELAFLKPMEDTSDTLFTFQPAGAQTKVTWTMSGTYKNFLGKAMCKCMNMDKMVGTKFEEGLASLKTIVEKPQETPSPVEPIPEKPVSEEPASTEN